MQWDEHRRYGYIQPDGQRFGSLWVHQNEVKAHKNRPTLREMDQVEFCVKKRHYDGRLQAIDVTGPNQSYANEHVKSYDWIETTNEEKEEEPPVMQQPPNSNRVEGRSPQQPPRRSKARRYPIGTNAVDGMSDCDQSDDEGQTQENHDDDNQSVSIIYVHYEGSRFPIAPDGSRNSWNELLFHELTASVIEVMNLTSVKLVDQEGQSLSSIQDIIDLFDEDPYSIHINAVEVQCLQLFRFQLIWHITLYILRCHTRCNR